MVKVEELIIDQTKLYNRIKDCYTNFINRYKTNVSVGALESRINLLETNWTKYQHNHDEICKYKNQNEEQEYFKNPVFSIEEVEENYCDELGKLLEYKRKLILDEQASSSQTPIALSTNANSNSASIKRKLPTVPVPKFNGDFKECIPYRDLFTQLVVNSALSDSEKLSLLKDSLSNEPYFLIKNLTVAEGQFVDQVWNKLLEHYNNDRNIVYSHVNTLLSLKVMNEESLQQLRKLVNQVVSSVDSLKALKAPTQHWNFFLVPLVVNCLDHATRKEWESSLGGTTEPSSFDKLIEFLNQKVRTLEALDRSSKSNQSKPKYQQSLYNSNKSANNLAQSSIPKSHNITKPPANLKCFFCSGVHSIYVCDNFRKKSVDERLGFIKASKLCFNCLAKHQLKDCKSQKTCSFCRLKHHSLLHDSSRSNQTNASVPVNDDQHNDNGNSVTLQSSNASQTELGSVISTTASAMTVSTSSCGIILLGTAVVEVESSTGLRCYARALIDPGSQISIASEALVQRLKLQRNQLAIPVMGVGSVKSMTKGSANLLIRSRIQNKTVYQVNVFIMPRLTSYVPRCHKKITDWPHIISLPLADPHFASDAEIDLILGVDIFPFIIEKGLIKGSSSSKNFSRIYFNLQFFA